MLSNVRMIGRLYIGLLGIFILSVLNSLSKVAHLQPTVIEYYLYPKLQNLSDILNIAASYGHYECLKFLTDNDIEVNSRIRAIVKF